MYTVCSMFAICSFLIFSTGQQHWPAALVSRIDFLDVSSPPDHPLPCHERRPPLDTRMSRTARETNRDCEARIHFTSERGGGGGCRPPSRAGLSQPESDEAAWLLCDDRGAAYHSSRSLWRIFGTMVGESFTSASPHAAQAWLNMLGTVGRVLCTCPECGQETFTGVISDKAAVQSAGQIRCDCEQCGTVTMMPASDIRIEETKAAPPARPKAAPKNRREPQR